MFRANNPDAPAPRFGLALVVAVALLLRLAWGLTRDPDPASLAVLPDQLEYYALAKSLLAGEGLRLADERFGAIVRAFRMPGYPLLVAGCGANLVVLRVVQAVLDASTVLAAGLLARRWIGGRSSLVAAGLTALNPFLVYFSGLILSETLFVAVLTWGLYLLSAPGPTGRRRIGMACWWGGLLLMIGAVYVRPSALGLAVVLGPLSVLAHSRHPFMPGSRWPLPPALTCVLVLAAALVPWALRNRAVVGSWVATTTNTGITLWDGFNPDADGSSNQAGLADMPQLRRMNEVEREAYLRGRALDFVRQHPGRAVELTGREDRADVEPGAAERAIWR